MKIFLVNFIAVFTPFLVPIQIQANCDVEFSACGPACCETGTFISPIECTSRAAFEVFADVIAWTAREAGADCWAEVFSGDSSQTVNQLREVNFGWDLGFRVGMAYSNNCNLWDTKLYYTRFYTRGDDHVLGAPGAVHSTFLGNFYVDNASGAGISGPSYEEARIEWSINYNVFDLELGREFCVSPGLTLRPFTGLKGGWIHQQINSQWINPDLSGTAYFSEGSEALKNQFWGLGPQFGVSSTWRVFTDQCQSISLFCNASAALLWGHWSFNDRFINDIEQQVVVKLDTLTSGATTLGGFMGVQWEMRHFLMKAGYEMQFWFDQLRFYSFTGGRLANMMTLQGGTFEISYRF